MPQTLPKTRACNKTFQAFHLAEMNGIKEEWYPYCHQSLAIITIMADFSNNTVQIETVSKRVAKRKYLLLDEDLEDLKYQLKDNPVNKSYGKCK